MDKLLYTLYGINNHRIRSIILKIVNKIEGGEFYSKTLRAILAGYHKVTIGMYTHGGCFVPGSIDPYTTIGRYTSIAHGVRIFNRDHPVNFKGMHAFFFNRKLGYCVADQVGYTPLSIGNDVWIGYGVTITANVKNIADGAVVGAGSNLTKDLPPYSIAVGNPARIVRYRFPKQIIDGLLQEQWWNKPIEELREAMPSFQQPYEQYLAHQQICDE